MSINAVGAVDPTLAAPAKVRCGNEVFSLENARPLSETARALTAEEAAALPWTPASLNEVMLLGEYLQASDSARQAAEVRREGRFDALNRGIGNMLSGAAIPNDIFSDEPVRTTSGAIHPQSDSIKAYLRDHAAEWKGLYAESFPSFEEWRQSKG